MSDVSTESAGDERRLAEHLQRAGELLRGDKLDEAEREIECALRIRSQDLRARNLRGLFLFRGGRYDEALGVYLELCGAYPNDAALRLNLGLVELRIGRHAEAAENLKRVVESEPDNVRAQGYLGLALMRAGELGPARDAFHRAGQEELARQVEERMAHLGEEAVAARLDLRRAPTRASTILDGEQPFGAVELEPPVDEAKRGGSWQLRVPGERPPLPGPEGPPTSGRFEPLVLSPPLPVAAFATARLLRAGALGEPFALAEGGMLVVRVDGKLPTRTFGAIASSGQLTFEPLMRRVRGQPTDEPFGDGADAMFFAIGHGLMVVAPRGAQVHRAGAGRRHRLRARDVAVRVRGEPALGERARARRRARLDARGAVPRHRAAGAARGARRLLAQDRARAADVRRGDGAARLDRARRAARAARAGRRADALRRVLGRGRLDPRRAAGRVTR